MEVDCRICVFAKPPVAGVSKTRLIPAVGPDGAAALARAFLIDSWTMVQTVEGCSPVLAATEPLAPELLEQLCGDRPVLEIQSQGEGDLGQRMERVLRAELKRAARVLALGTDSPGLPRRLLLQAKSALETADAVIGPTPDGGFYVLGLRQCPPGLLENLGWSTSTTCRDTIARLRACGLNTSITESWFDVDEPADLSFLRDRLFRGELAAPRTAEALARWYPG